MAKVRRFRAARRRQSGVAIIEFVFAILPLLLVVAWLMEYAMVQIDEYRVQDLAIAAAEAIGDSQTSADAGVLARTLVAEAAPLNGLNGAAVENLTFSGPVAYGTVYQVEVGATHAWLFGPFQATLGSSSRLRATAYGVIARRNAAV